MIGQMKMEVETSGKSPSPGPPGADDGGASDVAALVEGITLGSAWLTCGCCCRAIGGGGATGWVDGGMCSSVVVFVGVAPVVVHAQDPPMVAVVLLRASGSWCCLGSPLLNDDAMMPPQPANRSDRPWRIFQSRFVLWFGTR